MPISRVIWPSCIMCGLLCGLLREAAAAHTYSILELGAVDPSGVLLSASGDAIIATGIGVDESSNKVYFWTQGSLVQLGLPPNRINSIVDFDEVSGRMIGVSYDRGAQSTVFLVEHGAFIDWGRHGQLGGNVVGVTAGGHIVGNARDVDATMAAILSGPAEFVALGTLGGTSSSANDVNDQGQVVGVSLTGVAFDPSKPFVPRMEAFLFENGAMRGLGTLGGGISEAHGINNYGEVVGSSEVATGESHAFAYDATGGMRDLGEKGAHSVALGINDAGAIVGQAERSMNMHAALFNAAGGMQFLDDLIAPNSGWSYLSRPTDINERGQIVGIGMYNGEQRAFLMTPIPEPASALLVTVLLILLVRTRRTAGTP